MKQTKLVHFLGALAGVATLLGTALAHADGAVIAPNALDASARKTLEAEIAKARATEPAAFAAVRAVDTYKPSGAARLRSPKPSAARAFRKIGRPALYPMLELAAFQAERGTLDDEHWRALGDGLLQAIAFLRDTRAAPVLEAAFASAKDPVLVERAAEGLGMLCRDSDRKLLLDHARKAGPKQSAAVAGLAYCKRLAVAETLAQIVTQTRDADLARKAARSLGYVGSSWALTADKTVPGDEADAIRRVASDALVDSYAGQPSQTRDAAYRAILMVEHATAPARIDARAQAAAPEVRGELKRLKTRLERNLKRAARRP